MLASCFPQRCIYFLPISNTKSNTSPISHILVLNWTKEAVLEKVPNSVFNKQHFSQDHYDDDEDETAEAERIHDEQEEEENYLESSPLSSLEPGSEVRRRRMH